MFTGLVEGQGTVRQIASLPAGLRLSIAPENTCFQPADARLGDSISISGCCLTVIAIGEETLDFEAGTETLSKTSLGQLFVGSHVNLERSLAAGARLGGHIVQGHVDGTAVVDRILRNDDWIDMWFRTTSDHLALMVPKGSIAVDGVSLTLVRVEPTQFSVALIPHTLQITTLGQRQAGDTVNIENDILGKYVARLLQQQLPAWLQAAGISPGRIESQSDS